MNLVRKLIGEKTYLSPMNSDAAELWYRWHNDLETSSLASSPGSRSPGSLAEFSQVLEGFAKQRFHTFVIADSETDTPIGWCALVRVNPICRRAELAALIGERDYWGKGYGEDALRTLLDYGFHILNLNSIELVVHEDNVRARRCYEKLGFQVSGRKREARIHGDRKLDILMMDVLASEFSGSTILPMLDRGSG